MTGPLNQLSAEPPPPAPSRSRRPRLRSRGGALLVAAISTVVFFAVVAVIVVNAPGWERVKTSFLDWDNFVESAPGIIAKFPVNIALFLIAEVLILAFGLVLAVMRSLPGPVLFPLRLMATIYVDLFRALPGVLVIYVLGFGIPGLRLPGVPSDPFFWGVVALTLLYSAYVSEVYRAGIDSVHPSQAAAARSLGLSHGQALRHVVLPQAVRRVIPPLLNDFIGLQKDTVLVSFIGVVEIFRQTVIRQQATFNFTPFLVTALVFLAVTIPLARFTDWLVSRERDRRYAASVARRIEGCTARPAPGLRPMTGHGADAAGRGAPQVLRRARGAPRDRPVRERARGRVRDRRIGLWQVHPAALHQPPRADRRRAHRRRRRGDHRTRTSTSTASDATSGSSSRTSTSSRTCRCSTT